MPDVLRGLRIVRRTYCPTCGAGPSKDCDKDAATWRTYVGPLGRGAWFCGERVAQTTYVAPR